MLSGTRVLTKEQVNCGMLLNVLGNSNYIEMLRINAISGARGVTRLFDSV